MVCASYAPPSFTTEAAYEQRVGAVGPGVALSQVSQSAQGLQEFLVFPQFRDRRFRHDREANGAARLREAFGGERVADHGCRLCQAVLPATCARIAHRSEEHTSELQ